MAILLPYFALLYYHLLTQAVHENHVLVHWLLLVIEFFSS